MPSDLHLREGWTTVVLLLLLVLCVSWSIQAEQWTEGLHILQEVVLVGGILGIVLAKSRTPNRLAHALSALAGFTWTAWLTSRVLASTMEITEQAAVLELEWRLQGWLYAVVTRQTASGSTVFLLFLGILLWLVSYFSAWSIFRWQRVWWAVIACSLPIMVNVTVAPRNLTLFLVAFLLLALLLVVRSSLAAYEQEWRRDQVHYSSEVVGIFLRVGLIVSVVAIALAWVVPGAIAGDGLEKAWQKVSEPWRRLQEAWSDSFQDLNYRNQPQIVARSRAMRFGGPVNLTDRPILDIQAPSGRYWRNRVYHAYTGSGWLNDDAETVLVGANDPRLSPTPQYDMQGVLTQTVTLRQNLGVDGTLTAASQPLRVSLPVEAALTKLPLREDLEMNGVGPPVLTRPDGPSLIYPQQALRVGETYTVVSSVSTADAEALRKAGVDYPSWVLERYLALPDTLPSRVRLLAEQVSAGLGTPYEKAVAVETYLRQIEYTTEIAGPKPGQDGVEYFLFDERQGYCSYYASSMVVMLRAVGVPARYVEGYVRDSQDRGVYHVIEKDSHAWPEVFFPEYGWIGFEPTAAQSLNARIHPRRDVAQESDALGRGSTNPRSRFLMDDDLELPPRAAPARVAFWRRVSPWLWGVLGALVVCLALAAWLAVRRRRRVAGLSVAERVYLDLENWVGHLLRIRPLAHQTPHEYAGQVGGAVPRGSLVIQRIAELFVEERFGARTVSGDEAQAAWREAWPALCRRCLQGSSHLKRIGRRQLPDKERPELHTEAE